MTDKQDPRHKDYERARTAFEDLSIEDRAVFLVKEAVTTLAQGIEAAGRTLAGELDALFGTPKEEGEANGAEEAPAAEKKAAPTGARKTTPKKTTTRSTARKSSPKASGEEGDAP